MVSNDIQPSNAPKPVDSELKKYKTISPVFVILFVLLLIGVLGYFVLQRPMEKQNLSVNSSPNEQPAHTAIGDWYNRILYTSLTLQEQLDGSLHSMNIDGTQDREHPFVCDGEKVTAVGNVARSQDGKVLAFILPLKETRQGSSDWRKGVLTSSQRINNGIIYLYDLDSDTCTSTELPADHLYSQNIVFSPDGKFLAYVFYGLHVYDLESRKDTPLTTQEGSARVPDIVLGPLQWSRNSTTVYMPVAQDVTQDVSQANLIKVDVSQTGSSVVMKLPDYYSEEAIKKLQPYPKDLPTDTDTVRPDDPSTFAVSPDEQNVLIEQNGDLIMKKLDDSLSTATIVYNQLEHTGGTRGYTGHVGKVIWLSTGWIVYTYDMAGVGSNPGGLEASFNGEKPITLPGHFFSANLTGDKIIYNFQYFGIYYIPPNEPKPSGFRPGYDDTGHRYDGIGVYDLVTQRDTRLSGQDKPAGGIWTWFW